MTMTDGEKSEYLTLLMNARIPHTAYAKALKELKRAYTAVGTTAYPLCRQICGVSRSGKSMLVTDFQSDAPNFVTDEGRVTSIVYACIPPKGTTMGLLENLLRALGDPFWQRGTETAKLARVINLLDKCRCRAVILDEFQHLADKRKVNANLRLTIDFIKALVEPNQWLLVASGLPNASRVIEQDEQLRFRFSKALVLPRFDWFDPALHDEFMGVLNAFRAVLAPFDMPELGSEEMAIRFYFATGGLMGLITKILQRAVEDAVEENRFTIATRHLDAAFREEVRFADAYGPNGPFTMQLANTETSLLLNRVLDVIDGYDKVDVETGTQVVVKTLQAGKVTKADHKIDMAIAL